MNLHRLEELEPRRLLSTSFAVAFNDPGSAHSASYASLTDIILKTGAEWATKIIGGGSMEVQVSFSSNNNLTAQTTSAGTVPVRTIGNIEVDQQGTIAEITSGLDPNGSSPDVLITVGDSYLQSLYFDPNSENRNSPDADPIPAGKVDAYSVFLHELGHAFGFNGFRDASTGLLNGMVQSTFDQFISVDSINDVLRFNGPNAIAAYGQGVPLTRGNGFHLGNINSVPGQDLQDDLMNGVAFRTGRRYFLSAVDLAILTDTGAPIGQAADVPVVTVADASVAEGSSSGSNVLQFAVTLSRASTSDISISFATADTGSAAGGQDYQAISAGTVTIPAGQTSGTISVPVTSDTATEPDESFTLNILSASNATVSNGVATGVILNDDTQRQVITIPLDSKTRAVFTDSTGQKVTITLKGPGSGTVQLFADGGDADLITLGAGTTTRTALSISSKSATTVRSITAAGAMGTISGPRTTLTGSINLAGLKSLSVGGLNGATIAVTDSIVFSLSTGAIANSSVSAGAVKSFTATSWIDNDATIDQLSCTSLDSLSIKGEMDGDVICTGSIGAISAGSLKISIIRSSHAIRAVSAGSATQSGIYAGLDFTPTSLPTSLALFSDKSAVIRSITIRSKVAPFSDTIIAAPILHSVSLGSVNTSAQAFSLGLVADKIDSLRASLPGDPRFRRSGLTNASQSESIADLVIRIL